MANTGKYAAGGKKIVCPHCGGEEFAARKAILDTGMISLRYFEWSNMPAIILTCTKCSRIQWFMEEPQQQT